MKNILLLILLNVALTVSSWAQVNQINGTTRFRTRVTYGQDARTDMIPGGYAVEIIDANNYFFTIKYHDGNGYVNRNHIKYDPAQLKEFMKIKNGRIDLSEVPQNSSKGDDKYKYEIDHIRYCAGKYRNEIMRGYALTFVGGAICASPSMIDFNDLNTKRAVIGVGAGLGILGAIMIIDCNKWMKRMYIGSEGFGIRYSF